MLHWSLRKAARTPTAKLFGEIGRSLFSKIESISGNKEEAYQIQTIIRTFKKNMAPKTGDSAAFLETPNVFELTYRKGSSTHPFLHKFKQCFLENIGVNYTAEGTYATYGDGTPTSMVMDLSFKELEPIYDIDYDDDGKGVGY